ncbi:single-strand selective monofunctional uracil DNA glycosylase-like [Anneissia japonica]|uniref:single-strand selective monofunctional uracil DNA glycosylase-like n=1 Tax=Anneissia japonica TaxID=1529436 RepID=UPI001425B901|nr:single-strand selective monofunctional uracil DNA glycosylase-like [Anneissia japonica]XP_033116950.1 single-strand selective monofunctional uracil DNA glycosylase-like [Anneissia japonica]XP_033116951.1 single-strand selective monofunctional uracil DNA glycosylase-like [Anneissia japonica]
MESPSEAKKKKYDRIPTPAEDQDESSPSNSPYFQNGNLSTEKCISETFLEIMETMSEKLAKLEFVDPVQYIYNPVEYAKETHGCYVKKYCNSQKKVLFLGMNPGPFGMAQNGVPFGETNFVKDWLGIVGNVGKPPVEHPSRQIVGLKCIRKEVSGSRFWGLRKNLCGTPDVFFKHSFVYNICPLVFMSSTGKNITPPTLLAKYRKPLLKVCDEALCEIIRLLDVKIVVGVGKFAEKQTKVALDNAGIEGIKVVSILHPSPANPETNRGWERIVTKQLEELDLIEYFKN